MSDKGREAREPGSGSSESSRADWADRPAELARGVVADGELEVGVTGISFLLSLSAMTTDGAVIAPLRELAGPCGERVLAGEPSPLLDLRSWDLCEAPQPDRVRAIVRLRGHVHRVQPHQASALRARWGEELACFDPRTVEVTEAPGPGARTRRWIVPIADYRAAQLDPLVGWERQWVRHLGAHHPNHLRSLAARHTRMTDRDIVHPWPRRPARARAARVPPGPHRRPANPLPRPGSVWMRGGRCDKHPDESPRPGHAVRPNRVQPMKDDA